jgi:hypothetical protein
MDFKSAQEHPVLALKPSVDVSAMLVLGAYTIFTGPLEKCQRKINKFNLAQSGSWHL